MNDGTIKSSRSLGCCEGMRDANMFDVVRVSKQRLIRRDNRDTWRPGLHSGLRGNSRTKDG